MIELYMLADIVDATHAPLPLTPGIDHALWAQILPGRKAFHIPKRFAAWPVAASIGGGKRGPEAFHLRSILRMFRERFSNRPFRLIVYFDPRLESDNLITGTAAEAIATGMNCLIVKTSAEEKASWCDFLAKHLSFPSSGGRDGE